MTERIRKTDEQWRAILTPEQFRITRGQGTERAFTGAYCDTRATGTYCCVCCGQPLFRSEAKFDSGTGWPSFRAPVDEESVATRADAGHGMVRTEVRCGRCEGHLGHVFPDGPPPEGMRYCVNSAALVLRRDGPEPSPPTAGPG